ncbi:hypothetical protein EPN90_01155 [Patescibacteria group bacterium]|nr:MAG: hypothetical protein EPN90_01155 [Patescibacteria group bacterium]
MGLEIDKISCMYIFEKIFDALHLKFLNHTNSPSQKNVVKADVSTGTIQQAGRDIVYTGISGGAPAIEVTHQSAISDLARYAQINIRH